MNKPMTAEQFLNSIRFLDNEINALDLARVRLADQRQDILDRAENLSANLSGVCVQQGISSKTENLGIELASSLNIESLIKKLNEYQSLINTKIDQLVDRKREAVSAIDRITEPKYKALLLYRYIDGLKWSRIANHLGYSEAYIRNDLKESALMIFEQVLKTQVESLDVKSAIMGEVKLKPGCNSVKGGDICGQTVN